MVLKAGMIPPGPVTTTPCWGKLPLMTEQAETYPSDEHRRLAEDARRVAELETLGALPGRAPVGHRARGLLRPTATAGHYFPHDHARSRAYRWGEDGLLGLVRPPVPAVLCARPVERQRPDPQGAAVRPRPARRATTARTSRSATTTSTPRRPTPTAKALYKYPQAAFPYEELVGGERPARPRTSPSSSSPTPASSTTTATSTSLVEYAKAAPDDILSRITVTNRGPGRGRLHVLPTLWFRNTWIWGCAPRGLHPQAAICDSTGPGAASRASTRRSGRSSLQSTPDPGGAARRGCSPRTRPTTRAAVRHAETYTPYVKDAFHRYVVDGETGRRQPARHGTKAAGAAVSPRTRAPADSVRCACDSREEATARLASAATSSEIFDSAARRPTRSTRRSFPPNSTTHERRVSAAGLRRPALDQAVLPLRRRGLARRRPRRSPPPPERRQRGRNPTGTHFFARDVLSMPDKWEYPWFAAWDTGLPHDPLRADRSGLRQAPAPAAAARVVHAPQRPAAGLRVGTSPTSTRRSTPGPCWRVYKIDRPQGRARPGCSSSAPSRSCCSTSPGGSTARTPRAATSSAAASSGSTTSASSTAPSRCPAAAASSRPTAPRGWRSTA